MWNKLFFLTFNIVNGKVILFVPLSLLNFWTHFDEFWHQERSLGDGNKLLHFTQRLEVEQKGSVGNLEQYFHNIYSFKI